MKLKLFTLFALAALLVSTSGTALAQGPRPPAANGKYVLPSKSGLPSISDSLADENLVAGSNALLAGSSITNGGFELGATGWSQVSNHNKPLIAKRTSSFDIPTHSGSWVGWLGAYDNEVATLSQSGLTIDDSAHILWLWYSIYSEDDCGYDYGYLKVNSNILVTWDLCAPYMTDTWHALALDLSAYVGQTVTLSFSVTTDQDWRSDLLIDDVALGNSFSDVPNSHPYYDDIEILFANGLTGGCATDPLRYCPDQTMNRGAAAVFILRANFGSSYTPPVPTHVFQDDWTMGTWAEPWAEGMYYEGLSAGCQASPPKFCPWSQIPREQAVIFALRMKYGMAHTPPPATGTMFADMTDPGYYATAWAEQAYTDGIIPNCGTSGGKPKFCPKDLVSRGLGAYMIVRAKSLTLP
jgi:hypothetical protein